MIRVSVRYISSFSVITGRKEETLLVSKGTTLRALLRRIVDKYGYSLRKEVFSPKGNEINYHTLVLVNGRQINQLENKLDTILLYGDSIILTPPMTGG